MKNELKISVKKAIFKSNLSKLRTMKKANIRGKIIPEPVGFELCVTSTPSGSVYMPRNSEILG